MTKEELVYYPKTEFNGVLFVLREPHKIGEETPEETFRANCAWFQKVVSDEKVDRVAMRYRNRYKEMLTICGKQNLQSVAFTNINLAGGGKFSSKAYWDMDKELVIKEIINAVNPKYVFVCKEIFEIRTQDAEVKQGIIYTSGKTLRMTERDGIVYYEICHPCISPRIVCN